MFEIVKVIQTCIIQNNYFVGNVDLLRKVKTQKMG